MGYLHYGGKRSKLGLFLTFNFFFASKCTNLERLSPSVNQHKTIEMLKVGHTKGGSFTVLLTSSLAGLESAV